VGCWLKMQPSYSVDLRNLNVQRSHQKTGRFTGIHTPAAQNGWMHLQACLIGSDSKQSMSCTGFGAGKGKQRLTQSVGYKHPMFFFSPSIASLGAGRLWWCRRVHLHSKDKTKLENLMACNRCALCDKQEVTLTTYKAEICLGYGHG